MKTAVEWIAKELYEKFEFQISDGILYNEIIAEAKEMEKEQMIDFACDVYDLNYCKDKSFRNAAEDYYNEIIK